MWSKIYKKFIFYTCQSDNIQVGTSRMSQKLKKLRAWSKSCALLIMPKYINSWQY